MTIPPSIWTALGWTMLHLVWFGIALGLAASLLRRLLRKARPETRHATALVCLLTLAAAPFVIFNHVHIPTPAPAAVLDLTTFQSGTDQQPIIGISHALSIPDHVPTTPPRQPTAASRLAPLVAYLPAIWLAGSLFTLTLFATGLVGVEKLRHSSLPLDSSPISDRCRALAHSLGIARRVRVAVCDHLATPILIGVLRPLILVPPAALSGWTVDQLEMALLHELAHLRRHDNLILILQRLVESLLFFHPVTWWLSAWIRLERELCCDRLVVDRTGQPATYARLLATLGAPNFVPASPMSQRPLMTRIVQILNKDDQTMTMKLTLPEALSLLAATLAGLSFTLAAHAQTPPPAPVDHTARQSLARLAEAATQESEANPTTGVEILRTIQTFHNIARAQLKHGDHPGALATLARLDALVPPLSAKSDSSKPDFAYMLGMHLQSVELRYEAGDLAGARAALDRLTPSPEVFDRQVVRAAVESIQADLEDKAGEGQPGTRVVNNMNAVSLLQVFFSVTEQRVALGDMAEARALIQRSLNLLESLPPGPLKPLMTAAIGGYRFKIGDPEGGRALIAQARRDALALPDPAVRSMTLSKFVRVLSDADNLDDILPLLNEMKPLDRQHALADILDQLSTDDRSTGWLGFSGIKILIGGTSLSLKDPAAAGTMLPRIADATRAAGDARIVARTLAIIANLQARAGAFAEALATAESLPDLKRADFPGPADGFYDAVKPATFALIAASQAKAGDEAAASAAFARAETLARSVETADQKLVAQIVIARKMAESGRQAAMRAVVAEALPLALAQPEPRRSRVLTMLAQAQVEASDLDGAVQTIAAIRPYPGLEKARALTTLARAHDQAGDTAAAQEYRRQAQICLTSKPSGPPLSTNVLNVNGFTRDTFIDYDLEIPTPLMTFQRGNMLDIALSQNSDAETALAEARALPPQQRDHALIRIAAGHLHRGDLDAAITLARSIESPTARLQALSVLAASMPENQKNK